MKRAMTCTIDASGRLVVPKSVRERAGLVPGMTLVVECEDGAVSFRPAPAEVSIDEQDGVMVATPREETPTLTAEVVRDTLDAVRSGR